MKLYTLYNKITGEFDKLNELVNDVVAVRGFKDFLDGLKKSIEDGKSRGLELDDFELYCVGEYSKDGKNFTWNTETIPRFVCSNTTINAEEVDE